MTLGVRDTRKIDAAYNLTGDDVRGQARFDDAIGIFPEFIDGYGVLILPTTGRYFHVPYRSLVPEGRREPAGGRALDRRRQDQPRGGAQHDVLRGGRPGRRAAAAVSLKTGRSRGPARHRRGAGRAEAPGRADSLSGAPATLRAPLAAFSRLASWLALALIALVIAGNYYA